MISTLKRLPSVRRFVRVGQDQEPYDSYELIGSFTKPAGTYFGIENEIGAKGAYEGMLYDDGDESEHHQKLYRHLRQIVGPYAGIHEDCDAWEVCSPPLTFSEGIRWLDFLFNRELPHAEPDQSDDWGMHIHISRNTCRGAHLERMLKLLLNQAPDTRRVMEAIAERNIDDGWGLLPDFDTFCNGLSDEDDYLDYEDFLYGEEKKNLRVYDHRTHKYKYKPRTQVLMEKSCCERDGIAVNTGHGTHEFRLFRSTINPIKAKANLETVKALVEFSRHSNERSIHAWLNFVTQEQNKYPNLFLWMTKNRLV